MRVEVNDFSNFDTAPFNEAFEAALEAEDKKETEGKRNEAVHLRQIDIQQLAEDDKIMFLRIMNGGPEVSREEFNKYAAKILSAPSDGSTASKRPTLTSRQSFVAFAAKKHLEKITIKATVSKE